MATSIDTCPQCNRQQPESNEVYCVHCGAQLITKRTNHSECSCSRMLNKPRHHFCSRCGANLQDSHGLEAAALLPMI